jgi:hypothetical protein
VPFNAGSARRLPLRLLVVGRDGRLKLICVKMTRVKWITGELSSGHTGQINSRLSRKRTLYYTVKNIYHKYTPTPAHDVSD